MRCWRGATITPGARERIAAAADGNPLYVEQVIEMLLDDGLITREPGGSLVDRRPRDHLGPAHDPGPARGAARPVGRRRAADHRTGIRRRQGVRSARCLRADAGGRSGGRRRPAAGTRPQGADPPGLADPRGAATPTDSDTSLIRDAAYESLPKLRTGGAARTVRRLARTDRRRSTRRPRRDRGLSPRPGACLPPRSRARTTIGREPRARGGSTAGVRGPACRRTGRDPSAIRLLVASRDASRGEPPTRFERVLLLHRRRAPRGDPPSLHVLAPIGSSRCGDPWGPPAPPGPYLFGSASGA